MYKKGLVKMQKERITLQNIKGIGDKISEKIIKSVGGEEELQKIVEDVDVERIINIDGISQRKAIDIMNQLLNNPKDEFIKSDRAMELYEDIINKILAYSNTKYSKNRILLLSPSKDIEKINSQLDFVMDAKQHVSQLPIIKLRGLMKNLKEVEEVKAEYDPSKAILVESDEDNSYLTDLGLNQYYPILTASDSPLLREELMNYDLVFYVYSQGILDFEGMPNLVMINIEDNDYEIVPEKIINFFIQNKDLFTRVHEIQKIRNKESVLGEIIPIIDEVNIIDKREVDIEKLVYSLKEDMDDELEKSIKQVDLEGDEILNLLNNNFPPKIKKIFDEIINKRKEIIYEKTGIRFDPFLRKYPIEIDDTEIERIILEQSSKKENDIFDIKRNAAIELNSIKEKAIKEVEDVIKFDYEFSLGSFAYEYDLCRPEFSEEIELNGALHLELALKKDKDQIQKVDYKLTQDENIALLTGANSGGKTTLLETLTQISIMAQIGLPVSADSAKIKLFDEIYHFSKKRSLDAGAFESFLNVFIPIVTTDSEKLVLLDELEGITELDAAVKIISTFIDMIKESNSYGIIVTHMARELMNYTDIRVDGIEAKGLDENYNLIVDRTPKMNFLAKSTPELILKRIYEKSDDELKAVYSRILEKF
ncbi:MULTISPECIES: endonuclease MutS2 [Methanobrevibacter]|uniref:MutS-related protein n=2 Tax=Methanobacteriaceae TaxID=2159 RepID=UPI0025DDD0D2|nr:MULTISPECIES: endonuclease MutS2 [Methanobrevibacter]MCI7428774.1 endonuclease MutS2 [Methanobrevibacter sp.]MDY3096604.1 endonuclease MutS2 [Methanobrevibacter sp.]